MKTTRTPDMTEKAWQAKVVETCDWLRLRTYHNPDSRRSTAGFPDLVIVGPGGVIFVELKTRTGRVRTAQTAWLLALELGGAEAHVWRPDDWPEVESRLRDLAVLPKAAA